MAEAATQIRHVNIAAGQRGRSENNRGMLVIALLETAWQRSEAFRIVVRTDMRTGLLIVNTVEENW